MLNLFVIILGILRIELIIVNWEFYFFVFFFKILVVYILIYLEKFVDIKMMIFNWFLFFLLLGICVYKFCILFGKFIL